MEQRNVLKDIQRVGGISSGAITALLLLLVILQAIGQSNNSGYEGKTGCRWKDIAANESIAISTVE